jgi:hypothetical protein
MRINGVGFFSMALMESKWEREKKRHGTFLARARTSGRRLGLRRDVVAPVRRTGRAPGAGRLGRSWLSVWWFLASGAMLDMRLGAGRVDVAPWRRGRGLAGPARGAGAWLGRGEREQGREERRRERKGGGIG